MYAGVKPSSSGNAQYVSLCPAFPVAFSALWQPYCMPFLLHNQDLPVLKHFLGSTTSPFNLGLSPTRIFFTSCVQFWPVLGTRRLALQLTLSAEGGASFAFQAGIPLELIKLLGDWKSNAVMLYLTVPMHIRLHSVNLIAKHILSH